MPKVQYTREDLIDAAFRIAAKDGLGAVTVRKVAAELGCSVAPIYVNFTTSTELTDAVLERIQDLTKTYAQKDYGLSPFLNMAIGVIIFAKEYGTLFREITILKSAYAAKDRSDYTRYLTMMKSDKQLRGFSDIELLDILIKIDVFTQGLALIVSDPANDAMYPEGKIIQMLKQTGGDLVTGARLRRSGQDTA